MMKNFLAILLCLFMGITLQAQTQTIRFQDSGFDEPLPAVTHLPCSACLSDRPESLTETCPVSFMACGLARSKLPVSPNQLNFVSLYPE